MGRIESEATTILGPPANTAEAAHDLGNHLQIIASAVHLIERSVEKDTGLLPLTRCALESVGRVAVLVRYVVDISPDRPGPVTIENPPRA